MTYMDGGVYKMYWTNCSFYYYGSSINVRVRKNNHLSHLRKGMHYNSVVQDTYNRYGEPEFEILLLCETKEELQENEKFYLQQAKEDSYCANVLFDPKGLGRVHSEETRKKIGDRQKGRILSEDHKKKLLDSHIGRKVSETNKQILREYHLGKPKSKGAVEKMRKALTGRKLSESAIENIRRATTGSKNPRAKKVINTETLEVYGCGKELILEGIVDMKYSTFKGMLNGSSPNRTPFLYLEDYEKQKLEL